jgi:hypothetical protein
MSRRGFEFLDEDGAGLASQEDGVVSTAKDRWAFSKAGMERAGSGELVIPWPDRPRAREIMKSGPAPYRIDMPGGPALGFWMRSDLWSLAWNVGRLVDEDGESLITLRWTPESHTFWDSFNSQKKRQIKRLGEAVIAEGVALPTEPILLAAYTFQLFDGLSTGGS